MHLVRQRDSTRRAAAISELYTTDCTLFEAEQQVNGREALKDAPGFVFRAAKVNHDLGRLRWEFGPAAAPTKAAATHCSLGRPPPTQETILRAIVLFAPGQCLGIGPVRLREWRPPARRFQNLARSDREDDLTEMCVGAHVREGGVGFGERIGLVDGQAEFAGFCRWQ